MFALHFTFWPWLQHFDEKTLELVNNRMSNPLFDELMPFLRNSMHWIPLYLFLLVFALLNFRGKGAWWSIFFLLTVGLTDYIGTHLFKYGFERIRPCNIPELASQLRLRVACPSGYGFMSNHAGNHFGMATFIFFTLNRLIPRWAWLAFVWAAFIGYAQVYVGVHYPLDVLFGMLWGFTAGYLTSRVFNRYFRLELNASPGA